MRQSVLVLSTLAWIALAACSRPQPPDTDRPPEPQAGAPRATQLRDAIQAPLDKARGVEATTQDAADRQRAAIDAQTGG